MATFTLSQIKKHLRCGKFAWPGGYPLYFVTTDGCALSFEAVRECWTQVCFAHINGLRDGWRIAGVGINYDDGELRCDHTGERIESAYAE